MYYIAIIDDCNSDLMIMKNQLQDYCLQHNIELKIDVYLHSIDFCFDSFYDAIFLDIDMPQKNGLTLAKEINQTYQTNIIFMTNFSEYMHLTFEVRPFHFIHKEYLQDEITPILNLLFQSINKESIIIDNRKIYFNEIVFVKIDDHFCEIHTCKNTYSSWQSLSSLYQKLDHKLFQKVNQSSVINMSYIKKVNNNKIILRNDITINISRRMKKDFIKKYHIYLMESL